jgi:cob(I)alamin adenosyltransferase
MGNRLSKIYTRTGDDGTTGLGNGERIEKDDIRVCAYGTTDELNSHIGHLLSLELPRDIQSTLNQVQHHLFDIGGELCIPGHLVIQQERVEWIEKALDALNGDLPYLKEFILPGGNQASAVCHIARTVCRRAERETVTLARGEEVNPISLKYLNRLSDYLFVAARVILRHTGDKEVYWNKSVGKK